jgi:hypothetical protein
LVCHKRWKRGGGEEQDDNDNDDGEADELHKHEFMKFW